jgi:hypothetical protein
MKTFGSQTVRWEYKIIGDTRFAKLEGPKQGTFFVGHQDRTELLMSTRRHSWVLDMPKYPI